MAAATIAPHDLRCELQPNPVGIATASPRLSWKLKGAEDARNLRQTAYRCLVASSLNNLRADQGDLWDSGTVRSSETINIRYRGSNLTSRQRAYWKVRVTDQDGNLSEWSKSASFSVGLLDKADWKAEWIGFDAPLRDGPVDPFEGASWIWTDKVPTFAKSFDIPELPKSAHIKITVDDQFVLFVNDKEAAKSDGKEDAWRRPQTLDVAMHLQIGKNNLRIEAKNGKGQAGALASITLEFNNGLKKQIVTDTSWVTSDRPAQEVGPYGCNPWGYINPGILVLPPPRVLRHKFTIDKPVKSATLYVSALGNINPSVNGKTFKDLFVPGWTDYTKRVYAFAYDVGRDITTGQNMLSATLGDGWYAGYIGYGGRREHYGKKTRALMQLEIQYSDGTTETIASSRDWEASTGPILESDFLMGEIYDARLASVSKVWMPVDVGAEMNPTVEMFVGDPVREIAELKAKTIAEPTPNVYVLDLGQNIAGFARLKLKGEEGQKITLRFAERLKPDGNIYVDNLRGARATDHYICSGKGLETWQPSFTFHGFQYIEVSGLGRRPNKHEVVGIAVSSETPSAGTFECSDAMLNTLVSNARWTQWMNFIDIPTDCPQRDERLGWTGDAQAYIYTACMLSDVQAFFTKWLITLDDGQRADGQYPMVAPVKVAGDDGGPAWADAGVICPWTIYQVYGDEDLLARHYPQMRKFVEFCVNRSPNLLPPPQFHCFGDWVNIGDPTAPQVIYQAYFAGSTRILANAARVLGKTDEARKYEDLYQILKENFRKNYVSDAGVVGFGDQKESQCGSILALAFDLVEGELYKRVADRLVKQIEAKNWHLATGFVGTRDIMNVLSKIGRNDVAFRLLHNKTFPSWGFTIENGATSIWERWDGWTPERGFQDPGMNSFAHYAFGAVVGWMFEQPAGIKALKPGFAKTLIAPQIDPNLTWLKASYDSVQGKIQTHWKRAKNRLTLEVMIPPNTNAIIRVPGIKVKSVQKLSGFASDSTWTEFEVGSGTYTFHSELPNST